MAVVPAAVDMPVQISAAEVLAVTEEAPAEAAVPIMQRILAIRAMEHRHSVVDRAVMAVLEMVKVATEVVTGTAAAVVVINGIRPAEAEALQEVAAVQVALQEVRKLLMEAEQPIRLPLLHQPVQQRNQIR